MLTLPTTCGQYRPEVRDPAYIAELLAAGRGGVRALVDAAYVAGTRDKISAVVVRVR